MIDTGQMRAARAYLKWTREDLSRASGISAPTIKRIESLGTDHSISGTLWAIRFAFEEAGLEFIEEKGGVRGLRWNESQE